MNSKSRYLEYFGVASRWILGGLFIYTGWTKAMHPEIFLKVIRQYDITTNPLILNSIAAALPWFEIYCGLLLLAGVAVRGAGLLVLLMLVPFTAAIFKRALAVSNLQHIALCAVRFDCGCGTGEVWICRKLAENLILMALTLLPLAGLGRLLSARFTLGAPKATGS
ncbi:MAG TPA: MauE/DoxX family redox-associated membrane protein [Verrucomicrobiae bacterium]|nr:MauE/DoxX family redox-associated membrane protein [Verrucomicrobiae bacterium]